MYCRIFYIVYRVCVFMPAGDLGCDIVTLLDFFSCNDPNSTQMAI